MLGFLSSILPLDGAASGQLTARIESRNYLHGLSLTDGCIWMEY